MEKHEHSQLELFSPQGDHIQLKQSSGVSNSFLHYIVNYERVILIIIGFIITGIISFCCGVERGKKTVMPGIDPHFDLAQRQVSPSLSGKPTENQKPAGTVILSNEIGLTARQKPKTVPLNKEAALTTKQLISGGYTIQVASYSTQKNADRATEILKKEGFLPLILSKGGYIVVCVGNYSNMETAKSSLSKLRQNYRDCYIRRL